MQCTHSSFSEINTSLFSKKKIFFVYTCKHNAVLALRHDIISLNRQRRAVVTTQFRIERRAMNIADNMAKYSVVRCILCF